MTQIVTRAEWGARQPRSRQALDGAAQRGMAVHYTASLYDRADDHAACASRVRGIQNFHMDGNGWVDIAYSFLPCQHGYVFEGRGWDVRTAANGTDPSNAAYHAACFLGGDKVGRDDVQPAGRLAIFEIIGELRRRHPKAWEARPHSDFRSTACCGDELRTWIRAGMPIDTNSGERPPDMPSDLIVVNARPVTVQGCAIGGYWIVTADGGVFNFAGAPFLGSAGALTLNAPIVDMVPSPSGLGYGLVGADGGVFSYGDFTFEGSLGDTVLTKPIVDSSPNLTGPGYWMLGEDGGLFSFDAPFAGRIEWRG